MDSGMNSELLAESGFSLDESQFGERLTLVPEPLPLGSHYDFQVTVSCWRELALALG